MATETFIEDKFSTGSSPAKVAELKLGALRLAIEKLGSVVVAFSGGVDSTFLASVCNEVLGSRALSVIAKSPSLAPSELEDACGLATKLRLNFRVICTKEVDRDDYKANTPSRCFFCKDELYSHLQKLADRGRYATIANGTNTDDLGDFRPGLKAASLYHVRSPLVEVNLSKSEIRYLSKKLGLPTWDKPAQACLSSRIPYGTQVTREALIRIAEAEAYLRSIGIKQARVRDHDSVARIEVEPRDFLFLLDESVRQKLTCHFRSIGYIYVTMDLEGFRSGSLNEVLGKSGGKGL